MNRIEQDIQASFVSYFIMYASELTNLQTRINDIVKVLYTVLLFMIIISASLLNKGND